MSGMLFFPPDYLKDETNGAGLVATTVIMVTLASAFVGLRFYTRIKIVRALGASDWTILLALLFSIGSTACTLYGTPSPALAAQGMSVNRPRRDPFGHHRQALLDNPLSPPVDRRLASMSLEVNPMAAMTDGLTSARTRPSTRGTSSTPLAC